MRKSIIAFFAISFLAISAFSAFAETRGAIELTSLAEKEVVVTDASGKAVKKLVAAEKVIPGDEIIYSVSFRHVSDKPAEKVVLDNPVPEHMIYVPGSAEGRDTSITFSVDGGKTYHPEKDLRVKKADGTYRPAMPEDYTGVRWTLKKAVRPGEKGRVSFKAKLK
ncbi:MAG: hypothetical protein HZB23_11485 [Deltaproteobacteria bacterium]|nr:hypothetical protein [Deltaproteobacteria bacterium]